MPRSSVKGAAALRRLFRRLPDAAREEIGNELVGIGARLLARARGEAPVGRTGRLRAALNVKVAVKTLQLRLGLITKATQRKGFYGYILDQGRRAKTVQVKRRTKTGISTYAMRVKGIPRNRYDFVFGRVRDFRKNEMPKLRATFDRIMSRAAMGIGND